MSDPTAVTPGDVAIRNHVADLAADIRTEVADTPAASFSVEGVLDAIRDAIETGSIERALQVAAKQVSTARRCLELTRRLEASLEELAAAQPPPMVGPPDTIAVDEISAEPDDQRALRRWALRYVQALSACDLTLCATLAAEPFAFRAARPLLDSVVRDGTAALLRGDVAGAVRLLRLLEGTLADPEPEATDERLALAAVLVLLGRLELIENDDYYAAKGRYRLARSIAPESGLRAAGRAVAYLRNGQYGRALGKAQRAVELAPHRPEGHVALGMCAEAQGSPDPTDYRAAVGRALERQDPIAALSLFLGPCPRSVLVELARAALSDDRLELALTALDEAQQRSLTHLSNEDLWRREADEYELRSAVLQVMDRTDEAADALCDAVDRLNYAGDYARGEPLARRAAELGSRHGRPHWLLADVLRLAGASIEVADVAKIKESRNAWDAGTEASGGEPEEWAIWVRSALEEALARLDDEDPAEHLWAAVAHGERGMLIRAGAPTCGSLARYLRLLNRWPAALQASEQALALDPENLLALEERLMLLTNTGRFEEAEEVMAHLPPSPWLESVRAFGLVRLHQTEEALALLDEAIEQIDPPALWQLQLRAYCLRELGDMDGWRDAWEGIWNLRENGAREDALIFAWAAWSLDLLDQAVAIADPLRDSPIDRAEALRVLGLCELVSGRLDAAAEDLRGGVMASTGMRTLDEFAAFDLDEAASRVESPQAHDLLQQAHNWVAERKRELAADAGPEADLQAALESADTRGWTWVGAQAALARLATERERWDEAAERYALLRDQAGDFPEAALGLARAAEGWQRTGDRRLADGDARGASQAYERALALWTEPHHAEPRFGATARLSIAALEADEPGAAERHLARAVEERGGEPAATGAALAGVELALVRDIRHHWEIAKAWRAIARDWGPERRPVLDAALEYLLAQVQSNMDVGGGFSFRPYVYPIQVELSEEERERERDDEPGSLTARLQERVAGLEAITGIRPAVPRIARTAVAPGSYRVLVDEALVASGRTESGRVFCPRDALPPDDDGIVAHDPLTGAVGAWIAVDDHARVAPEGASRLLDPGEFIARHAEAAIADHLHVFVSVDAVEALLERDDEGIGPYALALRLLPDDAALLRFARLIRELVRERVPIGEPVAGPRYACSDLATLLRAAEGALDEPTPAAALRMLRTRIRDRLPGNGDAWLRLWVPDEWEEAAAVDAVDEPIWAPPLESAFSRLAEIHAVVERAPGPVALVTASSTARPLIREFIAIELPRVPVLAEAELAEDATTIETLDAIATVEHNGHGAL